MAGLTTDFDSIAAADSTYFAGDDQVDRDGDGQPDGSVWGEPETVPKDWAGGWTLIKQSRADDPSTTRFIVIRVLEDSEQALNEGGVAQDVSLALPLSADVPTFGTEQDATAAYDAWNESSDGGDTPDEGGNANWGEWAKVTEVAPWWVWGREHQNADRMQMLAAGTLGDESAVYLQADGSVGEQAHIFTNPDDLQAALDAYATKIENGEIPENQQPTGNSPSSDTVAQAGNAAGQGRPTTPGPGGDSGGIISTLKSPTGMLAVVVVLAALYYAHQEGYLDDLTGGTQS